MTNVTSTGAQAGVVEASLSGPSDDNPAAMPGDEKSQNKNEILLPEEPAPSDTAGTLADTAGTLVPDAPGFAALGLSADLLKAVEQSGYTIPTPIQAQGIPEVLKRRDVIGIAQTGTGKTASFTLPMIELLARGRAKARMPRSLILEPTRELAAQVAESFEKYGKYNKLSMALLIGGTSFDDQDRKLDRGVDVLIATPGRLLDHFERGKLMLSQVQILVIDEADRMLDMGFIPDVERHLQDAALHAPDAVLFRDHAAGDPAADRDSSCTIPCAWKWRVPPPPPPTSPRSSSRSRPTTGPSARRCAA